MPDLDELKKLLSTGQLSWETVVTEHPHLRPEDKLQLLRINLHSNRQGGTQPIEEYLATIPELAQHPEILFELLAAEIHHKRKAGYEPTFDEYLARFPTLAGQLPAIFDRLRSNDVSLATVRIDHSEGRVLQNRYKLVEVLASHVGTGCGRLHPPEDEGARL